MEHPREAPDEQAASIWRTEVHKHFMDDLLGAEHASIEQWQFGSCAKKPTLLRALNLVGVPEGMHANRDVHAPLPSYTLKGYDQQTHSFRTAAAKEYPSRMSYAMAKVILEALQFNIDRYGTQHVQQTEFDLRTSGWIDRICKAADSIKSTTFLPDYQPA